MKTAADFDVLAAMAERVVEAWRERQQGHTPAKAGEVEQRVEDLLVHLLDGYAGEADTSSVGSIFDPSTKGKRLAPGFLASLPEGAVPVAVMRELTNTHRVDMRFREVPSWARFVQRYGPLIRAA